MSPRRALVLAVALVSLGGPAAVRADDFVLTVPVRLTNLVPRVTGGIVACVVGPEIVATVTQRVAHQGERVGFGVEAFTVDRASRSFAGNVIVAVDAEPGKDPSTATHYKCWLQLTTGEPKDATGLPRSEDADPPLTVRPNTPATLVITGELPK